MEEECVGNSKTILNLLQGMPSDSLHTAETPIRKKHRLMPMVLLPSRLLRQLKYYTTTKQHDR
jgi:hypothetical protein